jgi:hypothetical protein
MGGYKWPYKGCLESTGQVEVLGRQITKISHISEARKMFLVENFHLKWRTCFGFL